MMKATVMIFRSSQGLFVKPQGLSGTALRRFPLRLDQKIKVTVIAECVAAAFFQPILIFLQDTQKHWPCLRLIIPGFQNLADGQGIQEIVKRQVVKAGDIGEQRHSVSAPVSYTHLDVYKRQPLGFEAAF